MQQIKFNIEEELKRELHSSLARDGVTFTDFFRACASNYVEFDRITMGSLTKNIRKQFQKRTTAKKRKSN